MGKRLGVRWACDLRANSQRMCDMLNGDKAFSGFSVNDIAKAKDFYGKTLGLSVADGPMGNLELKVGGGT